MLTDAINAWSGSVSNSLLKTLSKKIGEKFDKFVDDTRKALTKVDVQKQIFEYQVSSVEDGCRELAWKRVMSDENIKFQLGSVVLKPADDPSVFLKNIIQHSMDEIASTKKKVSHLEREQERLSSERGQALKRLEKCVEMKEHMDKDLYSKFCVILNEKKAKIRQLHQNGVARDTPADPTPGTLVKSEEGDDDSGEMEVDGGEEEREDDTDEEKEVLKQAKRSKKEKREVKDEEDSLILEDEEEQPSTSHGKRRRRKPDEKPVAMSSKPSIPRVNSTPKSTSNSNSAEGRSGRTPSVRKTPSSSRRGRSAELDASDLFDEM